MAEALRGLLVRAPSEVLPKNLAPALGAAAAGFELEPLFEVSPAGGLGIAGATETWYVARPKAALTGAHPWEAAHESLKALGGALRATGGGATFVEPDLLQQWPCDTTKRETALGAVGDACVFEDQDRDLPSRRGEFAWHLADSYSQLAGARDLVGSSSPLVRIAHLDTGYDRSHATFQAARMDEGLQRNFVDEGRERDASDPGMEGLFKNPGHGTGTLSILTGGMFSFHNSGYDFNAPLGGAPAARFVPVRVGNSVVQLTTSSVATAIQYVARLSANAATRVDVISMSMGGVASRAWADAVNLAYEAGIFFVAAAGNNFSTGLFGFPTHQIVYPARFRRVTAACGIMANFRPYYDLPRGTMQGNWGPESAMQTAMAAFTPNIAWARWGCDHIVRMSGAGTSSATPQIAAAAALYMQKHHAALFNAAKYPEPWMRVEAVRRALFETADRSQNVGRHNMLGNGVLRAEDALQFAPVAASTLRIAERASAGFPFLNVLSRRGLAASAEDEMLQLEATQLLHDWTADRKDMALRLGEGNPFELAVPDPDLPAEDVSPAAVTQFLKAVADSKQASEPLRKRAKEVLLERAPRAAKRSRPAPANQALTDTAKVPPKPAPVPTPTHRKLRGYAVDPSLATSLDTVAISEVTFRVRWEDLKPGPVGEYLEVIDVDPASERYYDPVNLDDPKLLAQDGLGPSEGAPQFHQQMVYAVASLTIQNFEQALGRKVLWRPGPAPKNAHPKNDSVYVPRLRIYPHALREENAFYSPNKIALLFGYFNARTNDPSQHLPGGRVFTCLSHDIIAHETTHAILDGMHRQFLLPSNPDVFAFHEGFADIVAMLQHFTFPDLVAHQIATTEGKLDSQENLLTQLASQFGKAVGGRMALRDAVGREVNGVWTRRKPDPTEYETQTEPHERGRILVSAVFDAMLAMYRRRTADLWRLATDGTGIMRPGALPPDLAKRLADEVSRAARHALHMCIRALDYCPPTDITFGEYLRAIITADHDWMPEDAHDYRVSFIESFRRWGIYPRGVPTLSVSALLWRRPEEELRAPSSYLLNHLGLLRERTWEYLYTEDRERIFQAQRQLRKELHGWLFDHFRGHADGANDAAFLGLDPTENFEVHSMRIAYRPDPLFGATPQLIVSLLQDREVPVDENDPDGPQMSFEGGCTVLADLRERTVRCCIRKSLTSPERRARQQAFALRELDSQRATYQNFRALATRDEATKFAELGLQLNEPFAALHRGP